MKTKFFPFPAVARVVTLPSAHVMESRIYIVLESTGENTRSGLWYSNGTAWDRLGASMGIGVRSNPPAGKCKVTNLFVDPATGRLEVEWDDTPAE